jgi:hypothetical protein
MDRKAMTLWECQNKHDHESVNVAVSKAGGRKFHCPDVVTRSLKYKPELWEERPLVEARKTSEGVLVLLRIARRNRETV